MSRPASNFIRLTKGANSSRPIGSPARMTPSTRKRVRPEPSLDGSMLSRTVLVDNWNEYAEGHYVAPTRHTGFGYLDALRNVFAAAAGPHRDVVPEEIGLGPYDSLFRKQTKA